MTGRGQIILGILFGFVAIGLWMVIVPGLFENAVADVDWLAFGLRWAALVQLPLIAGIVVVSQQCFWSSVHADGSTPNIGSSIEINRRYLTNTLEQSVLSTVGLLALSITVPLQYLGFVPALGILFVIGRICFWVAYHINPYARAFGLVLTFGPTLGVYVYIIQGLIISI
ncbi:MAG: hypothetical protein GKR91_12740 [Pseudomonadales bacterium]|nr:hypothetical protein [Pseudomonadales bacterium]